MKLNIIKKKLLRISIALATAALSSVLVLHTGLSWFADTRSAKPSITGYVQGSYFESGDGTSEAPYEVKYPAQLYYLAWLQDLGVFNSDTDGVINQTYFYLSDDLDMTGYVLPPIGTPTYPFVGNFDGNGKIISNLTVANDSSLTEVPSVSSDDYELSGYQIVGFFGVIGYGSNGETIVENENATDRVTIGGNTYTFESQVNEVKNFLLSTTTIQTKTPKDNKTLVGMAAGFVNGNMESVGVYNCSIETGTGFNSIDAVDAEGNALTDKLSNYSLIGYSKKAADAYMTAQVGGDGAGWGCSIDMESIFNRNTTIYGGTSNNSTGYTTKKSITYEQNVYNIYDETGELIGSAATSSNQAYFREYDSNTTAGAFLYGLRGESTYSNQYYYLNGGVRTNVQREYYYEDKSGYTITDPNGDYYLSHNADFDTVLHSTDEKVWFNDGNYYYFESYNISTNPIITHYLNADNYGRLSLSTSTTGRTTWTRTNNSMYCSKNGTNNYLLHVNGANGGFGLSDNAYIYTFGNDGKYLNLDTSSLNIVSGNSNDTEWLVTNRYIHTVINGNTYYLNANGTTGLSISTSPTTQWTFNDNKVYITNGGINYYIQPSDNNWVLIPDSYYITNGTNYLQSNLGNTTTQSSAQNWIFYNNRIYTPSGTYLSVNGTSLSTTNTQNNAATWTVNSNSLTTTIGGVVYHLQYNNGWTLLPESYYITDGTNYLLNDLSNTTAQNNAQNWIINNNRIYTPGGVYLGVTNNHLAATNQAGAATWTVNNNSLTTTIDGVTYYLQYDNGWKLVPTSYYIHSGNNYLQNDLSNVTGTGSADSWIIDDNGYIYYDGYYLQNNNGTLARTNNKNNATAWTVTDNDIYNGEYYLNYNSGWKLDRFSYYITDNNGNYLRYNAGTLSNTTVGNATQWIFDNGNIKDSTQAIYLNNNDGVLDTTTTPNSSNFVMENNYIISGDYYLQYVGNSWQFLTENSRYISNGTYYLNLNGTGNTSFNSTNYVDSATVWTLSDDQNGGYIYGVYNGTKLYLRNNNGTLNLTTNQGNATEWDYDDTNKTIMDGLYYLNRSNNTNTGVWQLTQATTFIISDGNGNYLRRTGGNGANIANTTDISQATKWIFSNYNGTGTIKDSTENYYLRNYNNGTLYISNQTNASQWTKNNDGEIYNGDYYLRCSNGTWSLMNKNASFYLRNQDGYYMVAPNGTGTVNSSLNQNDATLWIKNRNYFSPSTHTSYYLCANSSSYYSEIATNSNTYPIRMDNDGYMYYGTRGNYYIFRQSNGQWKDNDVRNDKSDADTFTQVYPEITISISLIPFGAELNILNYSFKNMYSNKVTQNGAAHNALLMNNVMSNLISYSNVNHQTYLMDDIISNSLSSIISGSSIGKHITYRTSNFQYSDSYYVDYSGKNPNIDYYYTYFPLSADEENGYIATSKNTGYIIGGSYSKTTSLTLPYGAGDIRISSYARSENVSNSISNSTISDSSTYTINANGNQTISSVGSDSFERYKTAKSNFETILKSSSSTSDVFGLHFMNAKISKNSVVTAKNVLINGDAYTNYEMPASSIDFSLKEKGYINFFAGTYFTNNNSFFSLHQIIRNHDTTSEDYTKITSIRELLKVYGTTDESNAHYAKYVYQVKDGETNQTYYEYSDGTVINSVPSGYELLFNTDWIKVNSINSNYLYYFEIPADAGEYCLGSVDGGTGAYLLYLDICANGGDIDNEIMEYIQGVDFVSSEDAALLVQIADNNPTACLALKTAFSDISQKVTITRTDIDATHIKFTFTSNASTAQELQLETRYYKLTSDQREITFEFVGV